MHFGAHFFVEVADGVVQTSRAFHGHIGILAQPNGTDRRLPSRLSCSICGPPCNGLPCTLFFFPMTPPVSFAVR
jgi:hypothetical protein